VDQEIACDVSSKAGGLRAARSVVVASASYSPA
jgi:hypothetical protein